MNNPTLSEIKALRKRHGLTQAKAASMAMVALRTWESWESDSKTSRPINLASWELLLIKTGEHPQFKPVNSHEN